MFALQDITRVLVILVCVCAKIVLCTTNPPSVNIKGTTYIGTNGEVDFQGQIKSYRTYKGIPYALPPVGELRFKKPRKLETVFPSPYMATKYGNGCLQPSLPEAMAMFVPKIQDEDCLYLNVFVPDGTPDKDTGYAVMVYIHGGAFIVGSGELGGEYPATFGNVIVASINYRLGIFGFLGTGDKDAPGNLGLWDQHLALQWVHDNIGAFGGDANRVTIFGESAGAVSVMHQALYPPNRGLFQRVIAESGTPALKLLLLYDLNDSLGMYAGMVGCDKETPQQQLDCLKEEPADKLSAAIQTIYPKESFFNAKAFPYLDNDFISFDPMNLADLENIEDNEAIQFYRSLDIINGVNSHEGLGFYNSLYMPIVDNPFTFTPSRHQMDTDLIPSMLELHYAGHPLEDTPLQMISSLYTDWSEPDSPANLRDQIVKLVGDLMMVVPAVEFSRLHVNGSSTANSYMYYFKAVPSNPIIPTFDWAKGANHVEELAYVFYFRCFDERLPSNDWEYELSYDVMTYWINFAKSGNPNTPEAVKTEWSKYEMAEQSYLTFDKNMSDDNRGTFFYAKEAEFWLKTLPLVREAIRGNRASIERTEPGTCSVGGQCSNP